MSSFDSPEKFFRAIPTAVPQNILFREKLHKHLSTRPEEQDLFLQLCKEDWRIAFNALFWTLDPRRLEGTANHPFILRPQQEKVIQTFQRTITNDPEDQKDIGIEKSREEGATELSIKTFVLCCVLYSYKNFICGSKTEDDVDKKGNPFTLLAKADHAIRTLPFWFRERLGCPDYPKNYGDLERTHLHIGFPSTNSSIDGESTNVNFAISKRATAVFLDEIGRVDRSVAESMEGSVHDVSKIVIYCSTHWLGQGHTFASALKKKTTEVIRLPWYLNPEKNRGLYKTPKEEYIEIVDIDYYRKKYPGLYDEIKAGCMYHIKDLPAADQGFPFIADAYSLLPKGAHCRSPWHDQEEERRKGNKRDFASNVWMSPTGASDSVFNPLTLANVEANFVRPPDFCGDIEYNVDYRRKIVDEKVVPRVQGGRLKWWGKLLDGRPEQQFNYVVGADPSLGTGNSNSVLQIYNRNTGEQAGTWTDPNTEYAEFADITVAICKWVGGQRDPFIVPERNGGHGSNYIKKILWRGYNNIYTQRTEDAKKRKKLNKYGWQNSRASKGSLCYELDTALAEGIKGSGDFLSVIVHDEDLVRELYDYVHLDGGGIEASRVADESSGARERHGDRVIALGLCLLGVRDTSPANISVENKDAPEECFGNRFYEWKKEMERIKRTTRQYRW